MITKKQLKILNAFRKDLFGDVTFKAIKRELKETSNSKMQKALSDFEKEGIMKVRKIGRSNFYSLNPASNKIYPYLDLLSWELGPRIPTEVLYKVQNAALKITEFFSLIVFGSYAAGKATKSSDLDVAIIVEDGSVKKSMIPPIETIKRRELIEIHYNVFTRKEFIEMLKTEEENVGKLIAESHIVFYNPISFYKMISQGKK